MSKHCMLVGGAAAGQRRYEPFDHAITVTVQKQVPAETVDVNTPPVLVQVQRVEYTKRWFRATGEDVFLYAPDGMTDVEVQRELLKWYRPEPKS